MMGCGPSTPEAYLDRRAAPGSPRRRSASWASELDEDPPLTEAGEIDCTAELLKELWKAAHADKFALADYALFAGNAGRGRGR